jgi:hypothetical protein
MDGSCINKDIMNLTASQEAQFIVIEVHP